MSWRNPPREPDNRLQGTSQGKRTDFPPKEWIRSELEQVGTLDTGKTWNPNLTGKLHPFFDRKHWPSISTRRFDALEQSFQLATRLLKVAGPYLCNFLPDPKFNGKRVKRLEVYDNRSFQEIDAANAVLLDIADHVQWRESPEMTTEEGFLGLNHYGPEVKQINLYGNDNIEFNQAARRAKRDGLRHRQLTVSVTGQFVDSLLAAEKGSHAYMVAAFAAAITIVHELGHTIFLHDIRYRPKAFWVGNDLHNEIGHSFIAWLFDGWIPELIDCGDKQEFNELRTGFYWRKQLRQPMSQPKEKISYSVPMTHIQRMLDHNEWSNFDFRRAPCASSRRCRSALLSPKTPFKNGEHARIGVVYRFNWFNETMSIRGFTGDQQAGVHSGSHYFPVDQDWDDGSELPRRSAPAAQPLGRLVKPKSPKRRYSYDLDDNDESSDTGDDVDGPFMYRPGSESPSDDEPYGDFGVPVADLDDEAIGDTERKKRGKGTSDDPVAVDR